MNIFSDRTEAGILLSQKLKQYQGKNAVILALPRGGVVTGYAVARALGLPLDIIALRKISHPSAPEYAIGAVDEHGVSIWNEEEADKVDPAWLMDEAGRQQQEAKRRNVAYRGNNKPIALKGKTAIIVDDGIATGLTMRLAMRIVRSAGVRKVVVAVPVASGESLAKIKADGVDEIVVLLQPHAFLGAVGAHYDAFEQVEDARVIELLRSATWD